LNVFGHWKTFIGRDELPVRPLSSRDISWLSGTIAEVVQKKEGAVVEEVSGAEQIKGTAEERGEKAKLATSDTAATLQGEVDFFNALYDSIYSGMQSKTPEIFVVAPKDAAQYVIDRHQSELKGTETDPSLTDSDPSSQGVNMCLVVTAEKGNELKNYLPKINISSRK